MKTNAVKDIRTIVAERNNCEVSCVNCEHCKHWGYNNGKVKNSVDESKCAMLKEYTWQLNCCTKFEKRA